MGAWLKCQTIAGVEGYCYTWSHTTRHTHKVIVTLGHTQRDTRTRLVLHLVTHNETHAQGRTPVDRRSAFCRSLYLRNSNTTNNFLCPSGIRTRDSRSRNAADRRLGTVTGIAQVVFVVNRSHCDRFLHESQIFPVKIFPSITHTQSLIYQQR